MIKSLRNFARKINKEKLPEEAREFLRDYPELEFNEEYNNFIKSFE